MPRQRPSSLPLTDWPAPLARLLQAAERECPAGHAAALRDLTALALRKVPARGIFDPAARDEHDLFAAIETIAQTHLDLGDARTTWRNALDAISAELDRDELEQAALQVQSVSDTAYFYAGLAFGLTYLSMSRGG